MPDLEERMEEMPEDLYKEIAREVDRMIGTYLTLSESETTFRMAKRKLLDDYEAFEREREAERRVRRRGDDAAAGDVPEITVQSPSSAGQPEESTVNQDEGQQDDELDMGMLGYNPTASHSSPVRERPSPTAPDIDLNFSDFRIPSSEQSRGSRGSPSSLGFLNNYSSSPLARPSNPTPRRGRGGPYSSDDTPSPQRNNPVDLSSEDVPSGEDEQPMVRPSNPIPRRAQGSIDVQVDTPRPKTARGNRFDLNLNSHDIRTPVVSQNDDVPVHGSPRPLITTRDIRERREKQQSRKLNRQIQSERNERRNFRKHIPPIDDQLREDEEEPLAEAVEARRQEAPPEPSRSEIPSRFASIDPEVEEDDDRVHFEDETEYSTSAEAIVTASPAVRHDNPLPATVAQSSSPISRLSPQAATKGQSRRSAAPSPPERSTRKAAKTPAAKTPPKTPAKTPVKQKAPPTVGTRRSGRIAKLKDGKK
ncbi:hypothetical protein J4E85_008057 [Alternaria conjuncta]|uniref:uncharacterized protein n=1 Tax=Alternaria conjuncta TaxID=181017 RepID=UPI00221EE1D9|nr:uncharacterized protein J4E85_008057 [Alternaria conjuncta]KAI4923900.1 hypothetical protein J4E85_008057 [Alternaria conjuncta]